MEAHRVAGAAVAVVLYFSAFVTISASHFAAWDVMDEVPSTTMLATWLRANMGLLMLLVLVISLVAGSEAARHKSGMPLAVLMVGGLITLIAAEVTTGMVDERIYPLTRSAVDVVPTHSVVLIGALVAVPLGTLAASRHNRFSS